MKGFMSYIATGCMAFTFSCIFYLLFSYLSIFPPFDEQMVMNMLFISIGIMSFIFLLHLIPIHNPFVLRLTELVIVIGVLLIAGAFFKMFSFDSFHIYSVLVTGILTYVIVIIVLYISERATANKINTKIRARKTEGI